MPSLTQIRQRRFRASKWRWVAQQAMAFNRSCAARLVISSCVALTCVLNTGCVRRRLTVRTNPPGAQVFVDDQEIGVTPCSASFIYYGTRKITVMKDGYKTET